MYGNLQETLFMENYAGILDFRVAILLKILAGILWIYSLKVNQIL